MMLLLPRAFLVTVFLANAFQCQTINVTDNVFQDSAATELLTTERTATDRTTTSEPKTSLSSLTSEPFIRSTFYLNDPDYQRYEVINFCNQNKTLTPIELNLRGNGTTVPAIFELSANDSQSLNRTECAVQFHLPATSFTNGRGLIVGIDSLELTTGNCSEYIEIMGTNSKPLGPFRWCADKTDNKGVSFKQIADNAYIEIKFHSAEKTNSSFRLVITQYQGNFGSYCPSSSNLKCKGTDECVSKDFKCDGHRNCPTGTDEEGCVEPTTPLPTTEAPITTTTASPTTTTAKPTTSTAAPKTSTHLPTTSTIAPSTHAPEPEHHGMSGGSIALTVIGVLVAVGLIFCGLYIVRKRRAAVRYDPLN